MRRSSGSTGSPENQPIGQAYWDFMYDPDSSYLSRVVPRLVDYDTSRYMNSRSNGSRDPFRFLEENLIAGSAYGFASLPTANRVPHYLIIENRDQLYGRNPFSEMYRTNDRTSAVEGSSLSKEDQTKAINKLRKQLYNPHMNSIVRRLGIKSSSEQNQDKSFLQEDDEKRCAVCLEDFESKQFFTVTPCNHMFHEECIVPWVKSHGKCPVCRLAFTEQNEASQNSNNLGMELISGFGASNHRRW